MAICHEWNTIAHLSDYEGDPEARPFTREEMQRFLDYADDQVKRAARSGRKGALAACRDAVLGAQPPLAEWGAMMAEGRNFLGVAAYLTLFPGAAITASSANTASEAARKSFSNPILA